MKRLALPAAAFAALLLVGGGTAAAQPASDSMTVTASNVGGFFFSIAGASFSFGNVNAGGATSSTGVPGVRNGTNTGAVYTATAATTWTCSSTPTRLVRIFNASTSSTIAWGTADRLSLRIPDSGFPPPADSCGFKIFTSTGDGGLSCGAGNLLRRLTVGSGANARTGNLDLQLDVLDTDTTGSNSWVVVLTANAL